MSIEFYNFRFGYCQTKAESGKLIKNPFNKIIIYLLLFIIIINVAHRRLPSHQWLMSDKLVTK